MKFKRMILVIISIFLIYSCTIPETSPKKVEIKKIGWVIENIDKSYWTNPPNAYCFHNFSIYYDGDDFNLEDIEYAYIISSNNYYWSIRKNNEYFDKGRKRIGGTTRFYSSNHSSNGSVLPIGTLKFELKIKDRDKATYNFTISAPGSLNQDGYDFVYTEDSTISNSKYAQMIKRANITSQTRDTINKNLTIKFKIFDSLFFSGWVWFYDKDRKYMAKSSSFRSFLIDKSISKIINNGSSIYSDGSENTLNISDTDITYETGFSFSDIQKFVVILTDGKQYINTTSSYDCKSISSMTQF